MKVYDYYNSISEEFIQDPYPTYQKALAIGGLHKTRYV